MVDLVPLLLFGFGLVCLFRPDWVAAVHRRQKAAGTTRRPRDVEVTDDWLAVARASGLVLVVVGLAFAIRSL